MRSFAMTQRNAGLGLLAIATVGAWGSAATLVGVDHTWAQRMTGLAGCVLFTSLFMIYRKVPRFAPLVFPFLLVIYSVLLVLGLQEPYVTQQVSLAIVTPSLLAAVLLNTRWIIGSGVFVFAGLLLRSGGEGALANPLTMLIYVVVISMICIVRLVTTTAIRRAEEHARQVELAHDEQQRMIQTIQDERDFAQQVMETMGQGLFVTDAAGRFSYVNPALSRMLGIAPEALLRRRLSDVVAESSREYVSDGQARWQAGQKAYYDAQLQQKGGAALDVSLMEVPRWRGGQVNGAITVISDITEHKRVMRMKDEFIATVSHELRTPLTSILGALGLVEGGITGAIPTQAANMIHIASKNGEHLLRLINDLLDIAKLEAGQVMLDCQPVLAIDIVNQAVQMNEMYATERHVSLVVVDHSASAYLQADEARMIQVLTNLISNAAKFSPPGATVQVMVQPQDTWLRIAVEDHGSGIPETFRAHIFEKFAQADSTMSRKYGGSGLGLSIAKALIEQHGGRIGFESVEGMGSTFWVDLPPWQPPTMSLDLKAPVEQATPSVTRA